MRKGLQTETDLHAFSYICEGYSTRAIGINWICSFHLRYHAQSADGGERIRRHIFPQLRYPGQPVRFRDGWHYLDEGRWKEVCLIGKSPQNELSWTISGEEAANKFFIKGKMEPQLKKMAGKEVIYVEDWSVIAPVHRIYQDESDGNGFFSPLFYLDQYDRENGDYYDIVTDIYAISSLEKRWIEQNSKMSCFTITSDITDNRVEWFIKKKNGSIPIVVSGNTPENNFGEEIEKGIYIPNISEM